MFPTKPAQLSPQSHAHITRKLSTSPFSAALRTGARTLRSEAHASTSGLKNCGNTCYLNSVLQCLAHSRSLCAALPGSTSECSGVVSRALVDTINSMLSSSSPIRPSSLITALSRKDSKFSRGQQNCAQEAFLHITQALEEDLSRLKGPKPPYRELSGAGSEREQAEEAWQYHRERSDSIVDDVFRLQLESIVQCKECGHRSLSFDPASDISAPLPSAKRSSDGVSLEECISAFFATEGLCSSSGYRCEGCKEHNVKASKQMLVYKWPKELVVTLKRFSASFFGTLKNGISMKLPDDLRLDLTRYCSDEALRDMHTNGGGEPPKYALYAVSNHTGSLSFGHYTALAEEGECTWNRFDDANVSPSPPPNASPEPYMLFFRRVGA